MRMCQSCRQRKPKNELIRFIRDPSGEIILDPTGKAKGRGAYLCPEKCCIEKAEKKGTLSRAFRCPVDPQLLKKLLEEV